MTYVEFRLSIKKKYVHTLLDGCKPSGELRDKRGGDTIVTINLEEL